MKKFMVAVLLAVFCYAGPALAAVNVNHATVQELESLTGIGQVKAQAIVTYRKQHGDFASVDDLSAVEGIGDKTVESLRSEATVEAKQ